MKELLELWGPEYPAPGHSPAASQPPIYVLLM